MTEREGSAHLMRPFALLKLIKLKQQPSTWFCLGRHKALTSWSTMEYRINRIRPTMAILDGSSTGSCFA